MELYNLLASTFNYIIERRFMSNIERFMIWNYKKNEEISIYLVLEIGFV
jgi:hypothetical protein